MSVRHQIDIPGIVGRSHVPVVAVFAPETPDRTAAIRGEGPSPLSHLQESVRVLVAMGASHFGVPCNTAHHFLREAVAAATWTPPIPFVDMIEQAAGRAAQMGIRAVGLLATTGTISTGLYQQALAHAGLRILTPLDDEARRSGVDSMEFGCTPSGDVTPPIVSAANSTEIQAPVTALVAARGEQDGLVMEAIYGSNGIKAGHTDGLPRRLMEEAARRLVDRGAEALILGCTEIPLVLRGSHLDVRGRRVPLVDATAVLASDLLGAPGPIGIAGGLGPEATIDLIAKLGAPSDFTDTLHAVFSATIEELAPAHEQDHLRMYAAALPDARDAAQRLRRAGATFLFLSLESAAFAAEVQQVTGLPTVAGPVRATARLVVRAACPAYV
ncbi:MAG: aspartate/glutamate racemase family protein [Acidobacteria bacterium]|nr:aspartate/glutamate racemase family protein [Acidobacteriota bacterium]